MYFKWLMVTFLVHFLQQIVQTSETFRSISNQLTGEQAYRFVPMHGHASIDNCDVIDQLRTNKRSIFTQLQLLYLSERACLQLYKMDFSQDRKFLSQRRSSGGPFLPSSFTLFLFWLCLIVPASAAYGLSMVDLKQMLKSKRKDPLRRLHIGIPKRVLQRSL